MSQSASAPISPNFPQHTAVEERLSGPNFSLARLGKMQDLSKYGVVHPVTRQTIWGKVFLQEVLDLTGMEISFGLIPPHTSIPFYHKHQQNEEVYLFLSGQGQFQVDGQLMEIGEGTAVRISPHGVRTARNTSDEPMLYILIQAKAGSLEQWTATDGVGVPGAVQWPEAA